jgi:hypothetical protein
MEFHSSENLWEVAKKKSANISANGLLKRFTFCQTEWLVRDIYNY